MPPAVGRTPGHSFEDDPLSGKILPTHHCFDDALELLAELSREFPDLRDGLRLVHAICKAPDGNLYAHAYVNDTARGFSLFDGIHDGQQSHFMARTEEYEAGLDIVEATRYTVREAYRLNHQAAHFGPWIERYRQLCSTERRTFGAAQHREDRH